MHNPTHTTYETEDEHDIIRKSQVDPEAFRPLYEKYFKRIFLFVLHRVGDKALTADITSQVFLKALMNIRKFQSRGLPFSAWLYRIAINECHDFFRKSSRHRMVAIEDAGIENLHEEIVGDADLESLHEQLPMMLEKLSEEELTLIELRFFEHRPFKEIADIFSISEVYAKVKIYRILDKLRKQFLRP